MAYKASELSPSDLPLEERMRQANRLFDVVTRTDPGELWAEHRFGATAVAITTAREAYKDESTSEVDESIVKLLEYGIRDIRVGVEGVFVRERLVADLDTRLTIAGDERTALALGILAARSEPAMEVAIGDYPGSSPLLRLSNDKEYIEARDAAVSDERRCPYAASEANPVPAPVFMKFAQWAARLAVYMDDPSYQNRTA